MKTNNYVSCFACVRRIDLQRENFTRHIDSAVAGDSQRYNNRHY